MKSKIKFKPDVVSVPASVRVAIYTRKSVEERTDEQFSSIDAQREAVEAYVKSQAALGWIALPEHYDDSGFTGANTNRPAFQRLLKDIEAGRVDVVATYKIDRLSRSIADFTRLMAEFSARAVTFVSITQQFSTTTSVGRMTLNLLATFAEFEREQISERTADKMGAARRKGMWTGGTPVLGYDLVNAKLIVNRTEAERVVAIFELYRSLGSIMATVRELNARGWKTKIWTTREGKSHAGARFNKASLHRVLTTVLYTGMTPYKGERFPGQHEAIVSKEAFDAVALQMRTHGRSGGSTLKNKYGALLKGLVQCGVCGSSMSYHHTQRGNRRHAYYVCNKALKEGASACRRSRAPAGQLEEFVVAKVRAVGEDPVVVDGAIVAAAEEQRARVPELTAALRSHEGEGRKLDVERANLVKAIGSGVPALGERLAEVDGLLLDARTRARTARDELMAIEQRVLDEGRLRKAMADFDPVWNELFPKERGRILRLLIDRVEYDGRAGEVEIKLRRGSPAALESAG